MTFLTWKKGLRTKLKKVTLCKRSKFATVGPPKVNKTRALSAGSLSFSEETVYKGSQQ